MHWTWSWGMILSVWRRSGLLWFLVEDYFRKKYDAIVFVVTFFLLTLAGMVLLCRNHRGLRHYWGLRVRGQHTKTTGRRGKTVGVSKKRWSCYAERARLLFMQYFSRSKFFLFQTKNLNIA
jgi:hypothetical protein